MAKVFFCENNFDHGVEAVLNKLRQENVEVEVESCLAYCGDCAVGPFALVGEEFVQAENPDELYRRIKNKL